MEVIVGEVELLLEDQREYSRMAHAHNPYGDGKASERIVQTLESVREGVDEGHGLVFQPLMNLCEHSMSVHKSA
jgi:UDP-N-acetylglucosamine 2-epimerase